MAKYSYKFKKKIVQAYLNNEGGCKYLANKYGIPAKSNLKDILAVTGFPKATYMYRQKTLWQRNNQLGYFGGDRLYKIL